MTKEEIQKGMNEDKFFLVGHTTGYMDIISVLNYPSSLLEGIYFIKSSILKDNFYSYGSPHHIPIFYKILEWDELYNWVFVLTPLHENSLY